jgi:hypothetical protein
MFRDRASAAALEQTERVSAALASLEANLRVRDAEAAQQRLAAAQAGAEAQ